MILVDTNVWVYSTDPARAAITSRLTDLIERGEVLGHEFVFAELLLGSGGPKRQLIIDGYPHLEPARVLSASDFVAFVKAHKIANKGVGFVDAHLLASALSAGHELWTEETSLKRLATEMGIAFKPDAE